MSYETRAYDKPDIDGFGPDPVVVLVATGTHDVSRLMMLLASGNCEQVNLSKQVQRQVNRHNGGRAALRLLASHGGPDLLTAVDPSGAVEAVDESLAQVINYRNMVIGQRNELAARLRAVRQVAVKWDSDKSWGGHDGGGALLDEILAVLGEPHPVESMPAVDLTGQAVNG